MARHAFNYNRKPSPKPSPAPVAPVAPTLPEILAASRLLTARATSIEPDDYATLRAMLDTALEENLQRGLR